MLECNEQQPWIFIPSSGFQDEHRERRVAIGRDRRMPAILAITCISSVQEVFPEMLEKLISASESPT